MAPHPLHHSALAIARSAGRLGAPVHITSTGRSMPAALSRYVRGHLRLRGPATDAEWLSNLQRIGKHLGEAVLVPIDDAGSVFVDDHADVLAERFLFQRRPPGTARLLSSKKDLHHLCLELGIPVPDARFPSTPAQARTDAADLGYPVVVKRVSSWSPSADDGGPSVQ